MKINLTPEIVSKASDGYYTYNPETRQLIGYYNSYTVSAAYTESIELLRMSRIDTAGAMRIDKGNSHPLTVITTAWIRN